MTTISGTPAINASIAGTTVINYPTSADPALFGLASFSVTYSPIDANIFELRFDGGAIVVRFVRSGSNFVSSSVVVGNASVVLAGNTATVTLAITKDGASYNLVTYRVLLTSEVSQGNVFYFYNTSLILPSTAVTNYAVQIVGNEFRVIGKDSSNFFIRTMLFGSLYTLDFYSRSDLAFNTLFLSSQLTRCSDIVFSTTPIPSGLPSSKSNVSWLTDQSGISSGAGNVLTFNITAGNTTLFYELVVNSTAANCTIVTFPTGAYRELTPVFPAQRRFSLASTGTATQTPPYLSIEAELTPDGKNIATFTVEAASSTWQCSWRLPFLPFASVLLGEGCTIQDRVESMRQSGLPVVKNLMIEYMLLRISLSAILGIEPFCCFSVELLRRRYWLPFLAALKASEFRAAAVFFEDPIYNLVGYEQFFEY